MNYVIETGRLVRDPEIRRFQDGNAAAYFTIAVDGYSKNREAAADFFDCVSYRHVEFAETYLRKGKKVNICGRLKNNNYTNSQGQKVYSVCIVCNEIEFAESKVAEGAENRQAAALPGDGFMNIPDGIEEELPFH